MHIVSYRGPGMAGGVSTALARVWEMNTDPSSQWWHLSGNEVQLTTAIDEKPAEIATLADEVVQGHYRFCNEFLWPIMHDLPQYARFNPEDYDHYKMFNETLGWCVVRGSRDAQSKTYFVQDYQMALLPKFFRRAGLKSLVFWHIPWPKNVDELFAHALREIVQSLLYADVVGFHTQEYAANFASFVQQYLPEFYCSADRQVIWKSDQSAGIDQLLWAAPDRGWAVRTSHRAPKQMTRIVVAPLGIDFPYWRNLASRQHNTLWHPALMRTPFILSVDRADYTKGVTDRLKAVDMFFEQHPEWRERITFAQVCGKTRDKISAFQSYWRECQALCADVKNRWSTSNWQPLVWLESSLSAAELSRAYRTASAMLVSAVRDGLNLTAKEYVACQDTRAGVLALSSGTGAWHELQGHCVTLTPQEPQQIADAILQSVKMGSHERSWRMAMLKEKIIANSLDSWWLTFEQYSEEGTRRSRQLLRS